MADWTASTMAATTLLAGCGGSDSKEASGNGKKDEKVTLTFPVSDPHRTCIWKTLSKVLKKRTRTFKINMVDVAAADYMNKLSTMLNGGNSCDIVYIKDADSTPSFAEKGQLEDLTSYIEKDQTGYFQNIFPMMISTYNGKQVALPFKSDYYVLYYNKDIFDAANAQNILPMI